MHLAFVGGETSGRQPLDALGALIFHAVDERPDREGYHFLRRVRPHQALQIGDVFVLRSSRSGIDQAPDPNESGDGCQGQPDHHVASSLVHAAIVPLANDSPEGNARHECR